MICFKLSIGVGIEAQTDLVGQYNRLLKHICRMNFVIG